MSIWLVKARVQDAPSSNASRVQCFFIERLFAAVLALAFLMSPQALAEDSDLVIQRNAGSVEIYFSLPANLLVEVFDLPPDTLTGTDGRVDLVPFLEGTAGLADEAIAGLQAVIGGRDLVFEGMSLMLHPVNQALPLRDPIDGMLSIGVCSIPATAEPVPLDGLRAYIGIIGYTDTPDGELRLEFPQTGRDVFNVTIRDFTEFRPNSSADLRIADGGALVVARAPEPRSTVAPTLIVASVTIFVGLLVLGKLHDGRLRQLRLAMQE
ncbi:MAG: hypothetical protein AAGK37_15240 [Pseudomonadota bacterium]